ncbi:MAG: glycosyltransferase [Bacteroidetes bacterium]|nr:glycosyltransferase [Bacteroidota bacterium]MBS1539737.1 glycosyltransferase [Bacteroidota bacterium]
MKHILFITSEKLNPTHQVTSIFELAQARAIRKQYKVNILSVDYRGSFEATGKSFIKSSLRLELHVCLKYLKECLKSALYLSGIKKWVNTYIIDDICVTESQCYSFSIFNTLEDQIKNWCKGGWIAVNEILANKGKPDVVHAHGRFLFAGYLAYQIKMKINIPYIYTEHSTYYRTGRAPKEAKAYLNEVLNEANQIIFVSEALKKDVEIFLDSPIHFSKIVPNVLHEIFEEEIYPSRRLEGFQFISVGALEYKKGFDVLIRAFQTAFEGDTSVRLLIVGDGTEEKSLKELVMKLRVTNIEFARQQPKEMIKQFLDDSDAFVLASRVETFGVVIIEALARGLPVLATRCGGPEFFLSADRGILVEPEEVNELVESLRKIRHEIDRYNPITLHTDAVNEFGHIAFLNRMKLIYDST